MLAAAVMLYKGLQAQRFFLGFSESIEHMDTPCRHTAGGLHVVRLLCACDLSDREQGNSDVEKIVGQQLVKTLTIKQRYSELWVELLGSAATKVNFLMGPRLV